MRTSYFCRFSPCRRLYDRAPSITWAMALFIILSAARSEPLAFETRIAQNGGIKGQVVADITDKRRPLPGVVVILGGERLGQKTLQTVSDEEGRYTFTGLTAGDYSVSVELQGFKKYEGVYSSKPR